MRRRGTSFVALVALLASGITYLDIPAPANAAIVTSSLVLNLDGNSTSSLAATSPTVWNSISPASSTAAGTINGPTRYTETDRNGLTFTSSNGVYFPAGTARTAGDMSFEAWVKPGNLASDWNLIAGRWFTGPADGSGAAKDWQLAFRSGKLFLTTTSLDPTGLYGNTSIPLTTANKWYHVGFTINATSGKAQLFINGQADSAETNATHTDNATAQLWLGEGRTSGIYGAPMVLSKVRIYNAALTNAQMAQNYLTDSAKYGNAPANTAAPAISGIARVGTALTTTGGTWGVGDADGTTTAYKWQSSTSSDGSTGWNDISGATSSSYTPVAADATNYLRVVVTKTNSAGSATATSSATARVQTSTGTALISGGKLTGLTSTVPNDANTYNVTLATNNLSATMQLGTTTGLTIVKGYASTASYMASTISSTAPIISFRGTGTAINTALANVTYTSSTQQVDVVKLYYATAGTGTETRDYIPIYDNNQLTFHYYAFKTHAANKNRAGMEQALIGLGPTDDVQMPGPWYLVTTRYQVEWDRVKVIAGQNANFMGAYANSGSSDWYWPANTDGYSSATIFGTQSGNVVTATSNIYNQTNTTLPFHSGEPNGGTGIARSGFFYINNSLLGWDDVNTTDAHTANFTMETFGTAPFSVTSGSAGVLAQTVSVVSSHADAPTGFAAAAAGTGSIVMGWNLATANTTGVSVTGYRMEVSTSSAFTTVVASNLPTNYKSGMITGLATNTLYYVRVMATTSSGNGAATSPITVTTTSAATTITVVSSGGGTEGTDYSVINGYYVAKSGLSVSINASAIQTALASTAVNLSADNVVVNAPIAWSMYPTLTLGNTTTSSVAINKSLTANSVAAWIVINSSTYSLDVKSGASINFTAVGGSNRLYVGGSNFYTVLKTEADLATMVAGGKYALGKSITLASSYTVAPINLTFTGVLDGLGNTIDSMKIAATTTERIGLINTLATGGVVRNLGVTNADISLSSSNYRVGVITGGSTGGTIDQVWSTGFIRTTTTNSSLSLGGLVGNVESGTLNISKSWSSVNIDSSTSGSGTSLEQGGLIGGDELTVPQAHTLTGGNLNLSQVYATGTLKWASNSHRGIGGLMGLKYSTGTTSMTDAFSWVTFAAGVPLNNLGGVVGVAAGGTTTLNMTYHTTASLCVATVEPGWSATPNCTTKRTPGETVSGISGVNWASTGPSTLVNLAAPVKPLYVQVLAPTDGSYGTVSYQIVDGSGAVQNTAALSTLNLSVSGTPVYKAAGVVLNAASAKATYSTYYDSGLTLGGTSAGSYSLSPWRENTSVVISKFAQTVTWAPTTSVSFGSGTFTPSPAPVASGGTTISYSVSSAGTTGCTVNSSTGAITYTQGGSCAITATAASAGDWLIASDTETFVIAEPATAPTSLAATTAGSGMLNIGWTAPTVSSSAAITGYTLTYSTNAGMTSPTTVNVGNTTGYLLTGLTAGTVYYFQVRAVSGSTWTGPLSTIASATPNTTATTINIVASGGGVAGTDYKVNGGVISATGTVSINASAIAALLATEGTVQLAATNVNVNAAISWSANSVLVLGNTSAATVNVNSTIAGSGATAGVKILPTAYGLSVKDGAYIRLTGATPSFNLGGTAYTVVNTVAGLVNVVAGSTWALTAPITLTSTYTAAVKDFTFTGTMDGLGNTVSNMTLSITTTRDAGFFAALGGATVRNIGFTNVNISSPTGAISTRLGSVAGNGSISASVTNTVTQVWATGFINQESNAVNTKTEMGGLFGGAQLGTLNISKSWSSVSLSSNAPSVGSGGIIGTNAKTFGDPRATAPTITTGNTLNISESYSTGNILRTMNTADWYGNAGIIGVSYGYSTTLTNVFSWGNINSAYTGTGTTTVGTSVGGIDGVGPATINNAYTTSASCGSGTLTNCVAGVVAGTAPSTGTGFGTSPWSTTNGASLVNLALPTKALYVQVMAPTDGSYGTMGYQIVDSTGTPQTLSSLSLSVSGTPTYTISAIVAKGTYSVAYVSGLTLGGSSASVYSLGAWITNTSVTISKYAQTITWSPTLALPFKTGTFTPSSLATSSGGTSITYSVSNAGTTGCTVNASTGVVTYTSAGTCTITATGDSSGDYLTASASAAFVVGAAPTLTIVASGGGTSGTNYTLSGGVLSATTDVSINAADLVTALGTGNVTLAGNVVVSTPITWSSNSVLTLGGTSSNTVEANSSITASGNTAGIVIKPSSYSISTKSGVAISLTGTTPTLSIGGNSYTLIKSISDLSTVTATSGTFWALAKPLTYSTTIDRPAINVAFAGTFDGLGNTVDNMRLTSTANLGAAFFKNLNGGTIRNLGVTDLIISLEPTVATNNLNAGGLVGDAAGGTLDQVWATGFLRVKAGSTYANLSMGGLVGDVYSGTMNITKSWSEVNINGWNSTYGNLATGGIVGGDFANWNANGTTAGGSIVMSQVYNLGDIANPVTTGSLSGMGGLLGVHTSTGTVSVTDAFNWGQLSWNAGANYGGVVSIANGGAVTITNSRVFQSQEHMTTGTSNITKSYSYFSLSMGGSNTELEAKPNWYSSSAGTALRNLPVPYKKFFVRVVAPTDGSYGTMSYVLWNGAAATISPAAWNFSITGTPTYTIASNVAISGTAYLVDYVSGLTISYTGSLLDVYRFEPYPFSTSVTISKYPQTVTWSPTTSVAFSSGSITPSALATSSGGTSITYAVTDAGATGCTVNQATAVITATAGGNCVVTATAANAGNYLAASTSVTFAIADASVAPSGVTTTPVGTSAVMVNWSAPTPAATSALTGYQVTYSTSSSMTSPTTVSTSTTSKFITGLTANTTYYFQVRAINGTTWYGAYSTAVTGATPTTGTALTVATTGGTQGTTWKVLDGIVYPVGSGIINAADLQVLLQTGSVTLAADTVTINSDVTWTTNQTLTLGYATSNTVNINADLTASGTTGGLVITPAIYKLDTKNNAQVVLSGSSTSLAIGGVSYTLIRTIAGLASVTATGNYALSKPLTFGTTALTASPINVDFTGTFDGLGNTFDGMTITAPSSTFTGLFMGISTGSFVRNLGITNVKISVPGTSSNYVSVGVLAGAVPSANTGTATVDKVWTTGFVTAASGSLNNLAASGVVGWARAGTINISQTWSSVNIDTSAMTVTNQTVGGILAMDSNTFNQLSSASGATVAISESYTTGYLKTKASTWRGFGGIMGLHYSSSTISITDSFTTGLVSTTDTSNYGGILGTSTGGTTTLQRNFTASAYCADVSATNCLAVNVALGGTVTGANTAVWTSSGASYLVNLPAPKRNLYVQATYTNVDGSFAGVGNQVVDGAGAVQTLSSLNLTKTGTATYTIDATTAVGTHNVAYTSGLTFGGTAVGNYNFLPYPFTTSVSITKVAQSISYTSTAPTTAKVNTTYTPTATSTSGGAVTFTIDTGSTAVCAIAAGVVTFKTLGNCVINANQAGATNWLAAPQVQQTAIATVKGDQSINFTTLAPTAAKVAGATYTPTATATSGAAVTFTIDGSSTSICSITGGVVSFTAAGTCIVDGDQAGNANWNAAPQVSQSFTVAKGDQTISFSSTATTPVVGGTTYTPTATKTAGTSNAITFSIDSTANTVCSILNGAVSFLSVGTCKVNANVEGNDNYNAATQVQQSFTVGKGSQTISFSSNAPNAAKVGGNTYTVTANAGPSTASVTLSVDVSTSSKCSVSGMVVTYLAVGDCVLNLNQAGDTNYNAAAQVQQTVTITSDGRCPNGVVSGNYCLIRFNSSGTWTVPSGVTVADMLVVGGGGAGGGGSGGQTSGGGGGGGEVIESLAKVVVPGTRFTISVGAGGLGGAGTVSASATASTDGSPSSISASGLTTITAKGGGRGGSWRLDGTNANIGTSLPASSAATAGSTGIAGGGGGSAQTASRANAAGNGDVSNGGGAKSNDTDAALQSGGGGGGAGGNGTSGTASVGGAGGAGKNSVILNALLGGGGGGGKRFTPGTAGTASAGGGAGGVSAAGTAGIANTGGGGGGSAGSNDGANGGSGVVVIRIALQSQTVAFTSTAPTGLIYGTATTYTPTVSGTASEVSPTVTVDSASSSVCSIASGVVSIIGAGTCTLNANQAGNGFYSPASQVQQSFTVAKQAQTISFTSTAPTTAKYLGSSYTVTASGGGSGNAVIFTIDSSATSICSVTGGVVTFTGVGTCTVNANQAGNANFLAASQVQQPFAVGKGTATLAFTSTASSPKVGTTYTVAASSSSTGTVSYAIDSASTSVCSIVDDVVSFNSVGTCTVNASQLTDGNWLAVALAQQSITVTKGDQIVEFSSTAPTDAVVDGSTYTVTTATEGLSTSSVSVTISIASNTVCSIDEGVVSFLTAGNCVVKANQAADDNWNAATEVTQTIVVGKGAQVISIISSAPTDAVVDGSTYTVVALGGRSTASLVSSIASSSTSVCSIADGVVSFVAAGECVVEVSRDGDDNYEAATVQTQTITVGKGSQVVAFTSSAPTGVRVGDSGYLPMASGGASTSAVSIAVASESSAVCELADGEVSFTSVGDCVLELNQAGDANYVAADQVTQTITVAKGLQSITKTSTDPADAVVDGATYTPTFTGGASGNAVIVEIAESSAEVCEVTEGEISFTGAGACDVLVNQVGTGNYEAATEYSFTITVGKGSQEISLTSTAPTTAVVGGATYTPTATGGASGNAVSFRVDVNTASVCAMSMGVVRFVGIGTCTVLASQNGNHNYIAAPQVSQTFTVGQGSQTITFTSAIPTAVVDGATYTPTATGGATGNAVTFSLASGSAEICTLAFGKVSFQAAGECVLQANQLGNTNYNAATQVTQSITVGKGSQVISFTSAAPSAKVSGTTYSPVVSGGASGNQVTLSIAEGSSTICSVNNGVVSFQAVGSCVVQADQAASANYNAALRVTQTITVAKGTQVVNFTSTPPSNRTVSPSEFYTPTATFGDSGEPVVFSIDPSTASKCSIANGTISFLAAGDCILHADQAGNDNFTAATRVTQIFDIRKGAQVVTITTAAPTTAVVDGATYTPEGTRGAGTSPIVFSATAESAGICSVTLGVVFFEGTGECVIALNQAGDDNYNAATTKLQTFTVGKGSQVITFTSTNTTATVDGATYTPTYTDGESLNPVELAVADSSSLICEVNAGVVSFHAVGDCVIEATQAGDSNYEAATLVTQTIAVAKGAQAALVGSSSLNTLTLGASTPTAVLNTSGGSGTGEVTWSVTSASAAYCSVTGEIVSGLASGYCDLVATKAGDGNYLEATATLTVVVSTGGQSPVRTSVSNSDATFEEGLTLTLSLAGGDGDGAVWFESLTPEVCNTEGGTTLTINSAGTCNVIGHKDGDDNYEAVQDTLSFTVAKAAQAGVEIELASGLTYSASGPVSSALSLTGVLTTGVQSFSVTDGSCTIENGELTATEAGDCEVTATVFGDAKYLDATFSQVFTISKATQAVLVTTLSSGAYPAVAWNGLNETRFDITGGSGAVDLTVTSNTPAICSVSVEASVVTVTGLSQGTCNASVNNAASANYLGTGTLFSVEVLDLAAAPTAVTVANAVRAEDNTLSSLVSWTAPEADATRATVTGYKVQASTDNRETWTDVSEETIDSSTTSLSVSVAPWTKYSFRVAATSDLDGETLNWAYFDLSGDDTPDQLAVGGGAVVLSTTKAATTSGETVYVTGSGFEDAGITSVEITTPSAVFAASIRPAALVTTKTVPATVISDTKLSFVLPKITLPKGVTTLQATIKVVNDEQLRSDPIPLDYIPKKLAQTITVAGLPATKATLMIGTDVPAGTATSTGVTPVVTATPANVCTAAIVNGSVTVTPIGRGTCTVSVQAPVTPAYTASAAKVYSYTVRGTAQTILFTNPGNQTWTADSLTLVASATLVPVFTSKTPAICTVTGNALTMVKAGLCTVTASQPGDSLIEPAAAVTQSFTIAKANRTAGLTATVSDVLGGMNDAFHELSVATNIGLVAANVAIYLGDNPVDVPVRLNRAEGTIALTVDKADAARCSAEAPGDDPTLAFITVNDLGSCKVTITLPADDRWNVGLEQIVVWINASVAPDGVNPTPTGTGDGELADQSQYFDSNPLDPDSDPAVALAQTGASVTASLGGDLSMAYDAVTGKYSFRSKTLLVGNYKATMTGPVGTNWFAQASTITVCTKYSKGKCVKSIKQPTVIAVNQCVTTLTVKKDPKLKKRVLRIVGPGCQLNDAGKAAFNEVGVRQIVVKYLWNRQYPSTALPYVKKGSQKTRWLKKVKRTIVLNVGRPAN